MDKGRYFDERANFQRQARLLRFIVFILSIAVVVNGFFVYSGNIRERTILVPLVAEGEMVIVGNDANDNYIKTLAKQTVYFRLTYSPANVASQFNEFLKIVSPAYYGSLLNELNAIVREVSETKMSSVFHVGEIKINRAEKTIEVKGKLQQWIGDRFILDEERVCVMKYSINHGRFAIERFRICKLGENCRIS